MKINSLIIGSILFLGLLTPYARADGDNEKEKTDSRERGYSTSPERQAHNYPYSTGRPRYYCGYYGCGGNGYYGYYNGYHGNEWSGWSRGGGHYGGGGISRAPYTPPAR